MIRYVLRKKYGNIKTVAELQNYVAKFMESMIKNNTDGVVFEGFEKLKPDVGYLFISNQCLFNLAHPINSMITLRVESPTRAL